MKKFLLSFLLIIVFTFYTLHERDEHREVGVVIPKLQPSELISPTPSPSTGNFGRYKNGQYIGSVADAFYGNIQVKAIIKNGSLEDVQFLQYPNDRSTSIEINTQAMPYLKSEAIAAQNANVDIVSGATDSSIAFRESLAVALSKAAN